jgi:hypothetical protein
MTTTTKVTATKAPATGQAAAPSMNGQSPQGRRIGKALGKLAIDTYERGVTDVVAFEKDAAKIAPYPWAKSALTLHAGLLEDIGAAYVKTARAAMR